MKTGDFMDLDKEIARVEKELSGLYNKRMSLLESEMQSSKARAESLLGSVPGRARAAAGEPGERPVKVEKAPRTPRSKRVKKRTRMKTDEVEKRIIETVKAAGSSGISLKGISVTSGVNYQTVAKKLRDLSDRFIKKGALKEARYSLKA